MSYLPEAIIDLTSNDGTYGAQPDITAGFDPKTWSFVDKSATAIIHFSFNGKTDAGQIDPALYAGLSWEASERQVWLRRDTPGVDTVTAVVMANSEEY